MKKLVTGLYIVYFCVYMVFTFLMLIPYALLLLPGLKRVRKLFVRFVTNAWGRQFAYLAGARVSVRGREKIPRQERICVVSNHQGYFDILVLLGHFPRALGFIAKKELMMLPIINLWMLALHCVFIDRKSLRKSAAAIERGARSIRDGYPMVIFPEGTRSRCSAMGAFKPGSMKLATKADAVIVPVTIDGTYKVFEEHKALRKAEVRITIHEPIDTALLSAEDRKQLPERLHDIIASALPA